MTWRELWKSTVTNLRVLLGFTSPPKQPPPPPAPIVRRKLVALTGPTSKSDRIEGASNAHHAPQMIDLSPTRSMPSPSTPLRTRKAPRVPVDVALDAAAFAAMQAQHQDQRAEHPPVVANPTSTPEVTWTRQGAAQMEQPTLEAPSDAGPFDAGDPSNHYNGNGYGGNGYGSNGNGYNNGHGNNGNGDDDFNNDGYDNEDEGVALTTLLESLLFVASEPVEPRQLAQTLAQPLEIIELGLAELADYYQRSLRGVRLQRFNDKVQLVSAPAAAPFIETFLNLDNSTRLSSPALETLAVIAYRQPVTRAQIEAVRGVDCSGVLRSLMQRGLVAEVGRLEGIGRPILYGVTELFMQHFGLMGIEELPPLEETEADRLWAATVIDEQENLAQG